LGAALAQTPAPASASKGVIGEITAVDASGKQLTVKADSGSPYTIQLDEKTTFVRVPPGEKDLKKASPIPFAELAVGDRVLARGAVSEEDKTATAKIVIVMTKTDLAKMHADEAAAWQTGLAGIVTAINPDTKEISVKPRTTNAVPVTVDVSGNPAYLRYASGSNRFSEAKPSTFAEIKIGDNLRARGQKNEDGTRLKADEILSGSFQTIAGTVISIDAANNTVRLTDLATKKPVDVVFAKETMVRRIPDMMALMLARRLNPNAAGAGSGATDGPGGWHPEGAPAHAQAGSQPPAGRPSFGGPGGAGGPGHGNFDLHNMLEKLPPVQVSELKNGDALIVTSTKDANTSKIIAITVVAGVEPILASAPRSGGQVNLGAWNVDGGVPTQ